MPRIILTMADSGRIPIKGVYAVEVAGACNLDSFCTWCAMIKRPRVRKRGLMNDDIVAKSLKWVDKLDKIDALALHVFGEPLLHPKFDTIAMEFSKLTPITMSTNAVTLDEQWADRLAKVPWAWITLSPWKPEAVKKAAVLLKDRGVKIVIQGGATHNWAGQAESENKHTGKIDCSFLHKGNCVIRWNGDVADCCISDRAEDAIGHVDQEPSKVKMRIYDLCNTCHHRY